MKRAKRRHHRERILRKRIKQYLSALGSHPGAKIEEEYLHPAGTMADRSALSCRVSKCMYCHPGKNHRERVRDRRLGKRAIDEQINES